MLPLPPHLTLLYHLPVELHTMAEELKTALAKLGCELTVIFYDAKSWTGCPDLPKADLFMGDRLIGEMPEYALEQWRRRRCAMAARSLPNSRPAAFARH
ncbi:hypothetical protein ACLK1Y_02440 [Escherichia coli]